MSASAESRFNNSSGPVHSGTGPQYNYIYDQSRERLALVGRDPRVVAREHLRWLHQRFIEPAGYRRARELLAADGSVLLTGPPGSGRSAAAKMLLHRLPDAEGPIRELPDTDSLDKPVLDSSQVKAQERLLLDLSASDEENGEVQRQLPSYRNVVRERGAHLVVVLPDSRTHMGLELGSSAVEIDRPDGTEVFQQYLRSDRIPFTREQVDTEQVDTKEELAKQVCSAPMRDIARLAGLVHRARELEPEQKFPRWLGTALTALTARSGEVAEQVKQLREGPQRALLLATAMFCGAPADAVFGATSTLLEAVGQCEDDRSRLERENLAEQLDEINAKVGDSGRVAFTLLDYDRAVLTHFWTYFPSLRGGFRDWVETAIKHPTLTSEDRDAVVIRFAEQALRTDRPDDLRCLAERWPERIDPRWPSRLLPQAARALEFGLKHEHHGVFFRHQLYTWSKTDSLSSDLAQVVVQVCSGVLGPTHPQQAVVRLHHVFRRHLGEVAGEAARDALLDLVARDHHLYSRLLARIIRESRPEEYAVPDTALFLELADPAWLTAQHTTPPLLVDEVVRARLVSGWKAALAVPGCAEDVRAWLGACEDGRFGELLLDVLVKAGDGLYDVLSRLYLIARDWAHAPGERQAQRSEIADRLNRRIDAALGIDFTDLHL